MFQEYDGSGATFRRYYVHATSCVDERAIVFDNSEGEDYYYSLKDLYTVDALVDKRGHEVERYTYDAYGLPVIRSVPVEDVDYSGSVNALDESTISLFIGQNVCNYGPIYDLDDDGDIDSADVTAANNAGGNSVTAIHTSAVRNPYHFTGRRLFMLEEDLSGLGGTADNQPVQYNRNRHYDPEHGRWLQRDPAGYLDGLNLYQYARSAPLSGLDPQGKWHKEVHYGKTKNWARAAGFRSAASWVIADSNIGTDRGRTGWAPLLGDQSRHFNRKPRGSWGDTRWDWFESEMRRAKSLCNGFDEEPMEAAEALGRGLHSIQDYWAHGDYSSGSSDTWEWHGPNYDDWSGLDAHPADTADGRAPQILVGGISYNEPSYRQPDAREVPYGDSRGSGGSFANTWVTGTKRNEGTEFDTKRKRRHFFLYVETYAGCECRDYFISSTRKP